MSGWVNHASGGDSSWGPVLNETNFKRKQRIYFAEQVPF